MPEQAEWQPNTDNAGDYTWKPEYALTADGIRTETANGYIRRAIDSLRPQSYDTRTLAQKLDDALRRIAHLEAVVHRYINREDMDEPKPKPERPKPSIPQNWAKVAGTGDHGENE